MFHLKREPELADCLFRVGEGEAIRRFRVCEAGGVEVHAHAIGFRPIDPGGEMGRFDFIAIHFFAAELAVERVQVEAVFAGDEGKRLVEIRAEFFRCPGFAGVVARHRDATAETFAGVFKATHVIALPAMKRDWNAGERGHGGLGIDAHFGVAGLGDGV